MKATLQVAAAALNGIKTELDGGRLFYFAGPVPADAADALDMGAQHTQCVEMTVDGDGVTGLTFQTATGSTLAKSPGDTWQGLIAFDGAEDSEATLTPTFYRFCGAGDDGRGAGTVRVQGTIGGPSSSADLKLGDGTTLTANGTNTRSAPIFSIDQLFLG